MATKKTSASKAPAPRGDSFEQRMVRAQQSQGSNPSEGQIVSTRSLTVGIRPAGESPVSSAIAPAGIATVEGQWIDEKVYDDSTKKFIPISQIRAAVETGRVAPLQSEIDDMAHSIIESGGVQQPVIVRPNPHRGYSNYEYVLVAGRKRFEGAKAAGLKHIPCFVKDIRSDSEARATSLLENLERSDLSAVDLGIRLYELKETMDSELKLFIANELVPFMTSKGRGIRRIHQGRTTALLNDMTPEDWKEFSTTKLRSQDKWLRMVFLRSQETGNALNVKTDDVCARVSMTRSVVERKILIATLGSELSDKIRDGHLSEYEGRLLASLKSQPNAQERLARQFQLRRSLGKPMSADEAAQAVAQAAGKVQSRVVKRLLSGGDKGRKADETGAEAVEGEVVDEGLATSESAGDSYEDVTDGEIEVQRRENNDPASPLRLLGDSLRELEQVAVDGAVTAMLWLEEIPAQERGDYSKAFIEPEIDRLERERDEFIEKFNQTIAELRGQLGIELLEAA